MRAPMRKTSIKRALPVLGALAAFAAPSMPSAAALQDENLLVSIPNGFQIGKQGDNGPMTGAEYIPQGETVSDWSRMVTVQVFHNMKRFDSNQFAEGVKRQWLAACPGSEVVKSKDGQENGYPFSLWVFACPLNPKTGKPENMFAKFISGNDSFYSIQYAYRSALTKDIIPPTMTYLGGVQACDSRLPDRPCPKVSP
jgi:hypothetical protein